MISVVSSELRVPTSIRDVYTIQLMKNKGQIKASIIISFCKDKIRGRERKREKERGRERRRERDILSENV